MSDFFVSYNKADRPWAEWIAWELEAAGYDVVLQAWDFRPGENFVLEMQRAASEARHVLAVLSPDYLAALYTQPEWAAGFGLDPTGEARRLIPVRVLECKPSGLLANVISIDLVGRQEVDAREALLAGMREDGKPSTPVPFPGPDVGSRPEYPGQPSPRPATPTAVPAWRRRRLSWPVTATAAAIVLGGLLPLLLPLNSIEQPEVTWVDVKAFGGVLNLVVKFRVEEVPPGGEVVIEVAPSPSFEKPWQREWLDEWRVGRTTLDVQTSPASESASEGWVRLLILDERQKTAARSEPYPFDVPQEAP
jgi:TIR domain